MSFLSRLAISVLGGCAMWAAHAPLSLWPLVFLSLASLWLSIYHTTVMRAFLLGAVWGMSFFTPHLFWASIAADSLLALTALVVSQSLFIAIVALLWSQISRMPSIYSWIFAALVWAGLEHVRGSLPFGGMPWGKIAFALNDSPLISLAPWGSTLLVGCAGSAISILISQALLAFPSCPYRGIASIGIACMGLICPLLLPIGGKPDGNITIGIIQGNSPTKEEVPDGWLRALEVTRNHANLANKVSGADLVVFPESTSDHDIREDSQAYDLIDGIIKDVRVPILLGTQEYVENGRYNDYLAIDETGEIVARYSKQHPVPFGEYIPLRSYIAQISDTVAHIIDQVRIDMLPGKGPARLDIHTARGDVGVATPICFEVAYDDLVAEAIVGVQNQNPASLIVVPTNNASFGKSGEPYQQFEMTRFRAVEHGRSAIQVSTTGVSGLIEPNGVVRYVSELLDSDARVVDVTLRKDLKFATVTAVYREYLGYVFVLIGTCVAILARRRYGKYHNAD
ncbi:apolipoprotein N-acyltransferase [Arcanobacterium buesumense]|uniref:Apolipoprotein N-acyltransferase n=1 Tax=Arcanobacterium buesumense TaxID=2722751 RepID=A0A6H2ELE9_9ACTO|nr:apolipoprotein N-acyltransferase [Arcanobacterium buesumense]QJC21772.1 apolipoprotein N-acyltransferase [Arcanobacterium buesumense]